MKNTTICWYNKRMILIFSLTYVRLFWHHLPFTYSIFDVSNIMFVTRTNVVYFSFAFFFNSYTPSKSHYFIDVQDKVYINGHWKHVVTQEWKNVRSTIHFIKYICFSWMLEYLHKSDQIPIIILWVFTLKFVVYRHYISYMNGMKTRRVFIHLQWNSKKYGML